MSDSEAHRLMRARDDLRRMMLARLRHELEKGEADLAAGCSIIVDNDHDLHNLFRAL